MDSIQIELPSIRDNETGYVYLFKLAHLIISDPIHYFHFNFKNCAILDQNAVAMLGGLARYVEAYNSIADINLGKLGINKCGVLFEVVSMTERLKDHLVDINLLSHFKTPDAGSYPYHKGDYIGYREHMKILDANEIALHLHNEWLSDEKIKISPDLKGAIISRIFEVFMNAYGHGVKKSETSHMGVISCGQYKKKERKLKLTVLDFGIGVIKNVRRHLGKDMDDVSAMQWALEIGNSTKTDSIDENMPRGLGFGLLNEFVSLNEGGLQIFSNGCSAYVNEHGEYSVSNLKIPFDGTMVSISINCDDRHYKFIEDASDAEQFF